MSIRAKAGEVLDWSFGLRNPANKYLTAETFGFKLNCAASIMKKKQIWFLEQDEGVEFCHIRSHLNRYLRVDADGNFLGDAEEKSDETQFIIEAQDSGQWCLKSNKYGWYVSGNPEKERSAFTTAKGPEHMWTVHLAMHPQVCLKNVNRKAYVHLDNNAFTTDEIIPWGDDATITVQFFDNGTYGLVGSNGKYLSATGVLEDSAGPSCQFIIVFNGGKVSFKAAASGKYLTALGAKGTCKATKSSITKDEMFVMEDSFPQIQLTAVNKRLVSIKQGVEVAASQDAVTDNEIFQVEPVGNNKWTIKAANNKFWILVDGAIHATADNGDDDNSKFEIDWLGNQIALKAANGKYVQQMLNGYLSAKGGAASEDEKTVYVYEIINRPRLVLRGEYGFIGTLPSGLLECNKSAPEVFRMEVSNGFCKISHTNGKYWKVGDNGVSATGDAAEQYTVSLHEDSMLCLMYNGKYFEGFQNGAFTCTGTAPSKSTKFEY
jgi:fascin 1/2